MRRGARLTGSRRRRYWSRATVRLPHWPEKRPFRPRSAHSVRAARPLEKARFMALADPQRIEALDPLDPLQLDAELSEEERMVRDTARSYARDALLPRVNPAFLDAHFDREIMSAVGALDRKS